MERKKWSWTTFFKAMGGVIAALGTVVTILVTLGIVGGAGGGSAIADAAQTTAEAGSARVRISAVVKYAGFEATGTGEGVVDFHAEEGDYALTSILVIPPYAQGGPARGTMTTRELFTSTSCYTRLPQDLLEALNDPAHTFSRDEKAVLQNLKDRFGVSVLQLSPATPWIMTDESPPPPSADPADQFTELLGGEGLNDPSRMLSSLESAADLEEVGDETLFGVPTKHYKGTLDPRDLPATLPEVDQAQGRAAARRLFEQTGLTKDPIEVWIDDQNLVRRVKLGLPIVRGLTVPVTIDFFDFGIPVRVKLPPADQVVHLSARGLCSGASI